MESDNNNGRNHTSDLNNQEQIEENHNAEMQNNFQLPQPSPPHMPHHHNNQQQTIVHVRDRLFHALFYRLAIMYARKFPKLLRRLIEFFVLMLAISSFGLLSYLHIVFNRNPINCLSAIQDKWPRDGILRVEIVHNASSFYIMSYDTPTVTSMNILDQIDYTVNYSLRESYEKEYSNSMLDLFSSYLNVDEGKNTINEVFVVAQPILNDANLTGILKNNSLDLNETNYDELINNNSLTVNETKKENIESNSSSSPVAYAPKLSVENHKKEIPTSTIEKMSPAYRLIKEAFSELQLISRVCKLS